MAASACSCSASRCSSPRRRPAASPAASRWLIAARVLQAVGAALLTPASLSIVLAAFPQSRRAVTVSLWGAVGGFAAAVGPSLGSFVVADRRLAVGLLHQPADRRDVAVAGLPPCCANRSAATTRRRVDGVGMALLIVAVGAIALAIVEADSPALDAHRSSSAVGGHRRRSRSSAFVVWARSVREPLVDLGAVPPPTYSAVERGHADVRHRVRDDVLRLLLLHGQRVALQPGARRSGDRAGAADGDSGGHRHRAPGRALRASAVPRRRRVAVRRGGALVPARARRPSRAYLVALAARPAA